MGQGGNSFFTLCGRAGKGEKPFLFRWVIRKKDYIAFGLVKRKKVFAVFAFDGRCRNCQELKVFPVKDIVVGPQAKQKEVIDGIKYFLQCNGYDYLTDKIRPSEIPYRE